MTTLNPKCQLISWPELTTSQNEWLCENEFPLEKNPASIYQAVILPYDPNLIITQHSDIGGKFM